MLKSPKADLRLQYRRTLEASLALSLLILIALMMAYKKFESGISLRALDVPAIEVEDIPITRTVKKIEVPRKPSIPIEDPEIDPAEDIDIADIEFFDPTVAPPPPPPRIEDEWVPFFKVEVPPQLVGGEQAIMSYIVRHNLFPATAAEVGISGVALIEFIVGKDGVPHDVVVVQDKPPNLGFGDAGVTVMKAMKFTPGMQRDRAVAVKMQQKIIFSIE